MVDASIESSSVSSDEHRRIRAHYERAIPLLEKHFFGTPLISVTYPNGWSGRAIFHTSFATLPASIDTVSVLTSSGMHPYVQLSGHNITWICAAHYAVELDGWGPTLHDPERAAFARLVLSPQGSVSEDRVVAGARQIGELLAAEGLTSIPVLDGVRGLVLWIPLSDAPTYDRVNAWLHAFAMRAAMLARETFTVAALRAERGNRIYLGTKSNRPGMGTLLPYALRGTPALEVSLPIAFGALGTIRNGDVTEANFAEHLHTAGDVFGAERERIGSQPFGDRGTGLATIVAIGETNDPLPNNYMVEAALIALADGKAHSADEILASGLEHGLLPKSTTRKYVYTALHGYIARTIGAGKTPAILQIEGSAMFRLNEPADTWPDVPLPTLPHWIAADVATELTTRLQATSTGTDTAAFEVAACDGFAALGFLATHVGGEGTPDGILAAPLGAAGYRVILECKTSEENKPVSNPRPEEAAKFRDAALATKSILIGPYFAGDLSLDEELRTHGVALWTVDDLVGAIAAQIGPDELRPALEAGRSESALRSIIWERRHGKRKRVAVIMERLTNSMWRTQTTLAKTVAITETPALNEDTLFVLVDEALAAEGVVDGARLDETREAIASLVAAGVLVFDNGGYVLREPPATPT